MDISVKLNVPKERLFIPYLLIFLQNTEKIIHCLGIIKTFNRGFKPNNGKFPLISQLYIINSKLMLKSSFRLFPLFAKLYAQPHTLKSIAPLLQKSNVYAFSKHQKHEEHHDKQKNSQQ